MRGLTVLATVAAIWVLVVGDLPFKDLRIPKVRLIVLAASIGAFFLGSVIAYGLLGVTVPAAAIGLLCGTVPTRLERSRSDRRLNDRRDRWPDLVAHMRSSVAAGATLTDAFIDATSRIGGEYTRYCDVAMHEITYGGGFDVALAQLRSELEDPIADRVLSTLSIAQGTGGHRVGEVLTTLGRSIADEIRLRKAHDASMTEQRMTATVALVAPWALLSLSIATNPQAAWAFETREGTMVVIIGFVATCLGWVFARRASRLSVAPRLFT